MKILPKTILFDLDNTLLRMDEETFINLYMDSLAGTFKDRLDAQKLVKSIWEGVEAIYRNNGQKTNEEAFWDCVEEKYGQDLRPMLPEFENFYRTEFENARSSCQARPQVREFIESLKPDHQLILATNPIFPRVAVEARLKWAGLRAEDFDYITTYENSTACKPNPVYYQEIMKKTGAVPCECVMIGNDADEDMSAAVTGMDTILITDDLINRKNKDLSVYEQMTWKELTQAA